MQSNHIYLSTYQHHNICMDIFFPFDLRIYIENVESKSLIFLGNLKTIP